MPHYEGSCHCGAVKFAVETANPIAKGLRCNCSICARKGAMMSAEVFSEEHLQRQITDDTLGLYQFDSGAAKHYFCKKCGIYPFHETVRAPGSYRVNLGCIDEIDVVNLPFDVFDGKHLL